MGQNKHMKDNRIEKVKQHYFVNLNDKRLKILKHKIVVDKSLLTLKTKIFGQDFPSGDNITASFSEDNNQTFVVAWNGMYKDEKIEIWEYKIVSGN